MAQGVGVLGRLEIRVKFGMGMEYSGMNIHDTQR